MDKQEAIGELTLERDDVIGEIEAIKNNLRKVIAQFSLFTHPMDITNVVMEVTEHGIKLGNDGAAGFIARDATEQFYRLVKDLQEAEQKKEQIESQLKDKGLKNTLGRP